MPTAAAVNDASTIDRVKDIPMTNRQFVALVRAGLDAAGHRDIPIERSWIDEDEPGNPFRLIVPVGPELVLPLKPRDDHFRGFDAERAAEHVGYFVKALINLKQAERVLLKYARDVRRAAAKAVADARATGLDILLVDVGLNATYVGHLTYNSWKDGVSYVLADVKVRNTSFHLRPEISSVLVGDPADVADELQSIFDDQCERQQRVAYMDGLGADLILDALTLDLLRTHADDVEQVLRDVWKKQHVSIPLNLDGFATELSATSSNGSVVACITLPEVFWNGEVLWLTGDATENGIDLVGKTLAGTVSHPSFARCTVAKVDQWDRETGKPHTYGLDLTERFLFDAEIGRIWPGPCDPAA